jgi:hypothetical protein
MSGESIFLELFGEGSLEDENDMYHFHVNPNTLNHVVGTFFPMSLWKNFINYDQIHLLLSKSRFRSIIRYLENNYNGNPVNEVIPFTPNDVIAFIRYMNHHPVRIGNIHRFQSLYETTPLFFDIDDEDVVFKNSSRNNIFDKFLPHEIASLFHKNRRSEAISFKDFNVVLNWFLDSYPDPKPLFIVPKVISIIELKYRRNISWIHYTPGYSKNSCKFAIIPRSERSRQRLLKDSFLQQFKLVLSETVKLIIHIYNIQFVYNELYKNEHRLRPRNISEKLQTHLDLPVKIKDLIASHLYKETPTEEHERLRNRLLQHHIPLSNIYNLVNEYDPNLEGLDFSRLALPQLDGGYSLDELEAIVKSLHAETPIMKSKYEESLRKKSLTSFITRNEVNSLRKKELIRLILQELHRRGYGELIK